MTPIQNELRAFDHECITALESQIADLERDNAALRTQLATVRAETFERCAVIAEIDIASERTLRDRCDCTPESEAWAAAHGAAADTAEQIASRIRAAAKEASPS